MPYVPKPSRCFLVGASTTGSRGLPLEKRYNGPTQVIMSSMIDRQLGVIYAI